MTDELLAHHWGEAAAAFPKMTRTLFQVGSNSVHATRQRVRSRATKAGGNVKRRTESQKQRLELSSYGGNSAANFCGGNPQREAP